MVKAEAFRRESDDDSGRRYPRLRKQEGTEFAIEAAGVLDV